MRQAGFAKHHGCGIVIAASLILMAIPLDSKATVDEQLARFEWHLLDWVQPSDIKFFEVSASDFLYQAKQAEFSLPEKIHVYVSPAGFKASFHGSRQKSQLHISLRHFVRSENLVESRRKHQKETLSVALHELSHALFIANFAPKPPQGIWPEYEALERTKHSLYQQYQSSDADKREETELLSKQQAMRESKPEKFEAWYKANRANGSLRLAFEELFADLIVTIFMSDPQVVHSAIRFDDHTDSPKGELRDFTQGEWSDDPKVLAGFYQRYGGPDGVLMQKPHYQLAPLRHQIWQQLMADKSMPERFIAARELLLKFEQAYFVLGANTTGKTLNMNQLLRQVLLNGGE